MPEQIHSHLLTIDVSHLENLDMPTSVIKTETNFGCLDKGISAAHCAYNELAMVKIS